MTYRTSAPTAPVAPPPAEIQERRTLLEPTIFSVAANSLRAVFAGLGLALIVACVLWWLQFRGWDVGVHFLRTWGIASGILLFVLHSSDRIAFVLSQWQLHGVRTDLDAAEAEIEMLEIENRTLRSENATISWRLQEAQNHRNFTPAEAPEDTVYRDARELIRWWAKTGQHPARRKIGWAESRHSAAMWVLQNKGIVTVAGKGNVVTWAAHDAATALAILAGRGVATRPDQSETLPATPETE